MKKTVLFMFFFALVGILVNIIRYWPDGKLHLFFCDVGQGDAIYLRFPDNADMLIDGGPSNKKVLSCLSSAMPFYDRSIDVVLLTHPQADHLGGLVDVLGRYRVDRMIMPPVGNKTEGYKNIVSLLEKHQISVRNLYAGAGIDFDKVKLSIVWPQRSWVAQVLGNQNCLMVRDVCIVQSSKGDLSRQDIASVLWGTGSVLGASTTKDLNQFSIIVHLSYGTFDALFTGDADAAVQQVMFDKGVVFGESSADPIEVLKVPHHGSRTGMLDEFLDRIQPNLAVIEVGKKNRYGHPSSEILRRLLERSITVKRTDIDGLIHVVSDGDSWQVR